MRGPALVENNVEALRASFPTVRLELDDPVKVIIPAIISKLDAVKIAVMAQDICNNGLAGDSKVEEIDGEIVITLFPD